MDKIAIISDVHGNLEALKTVFSDIEKRGITKIFCLGDTIAKGVHQQECVDLIKEKCEVVIKGNCEDYFTSDIDVSDLEGIRKKRYLWNKSKIDEATKIYLRNLPYCFEFYLSGRLVRLIHAHPDKIDKFVGNIDKIERYRELLMPSESTVSNLMADIVIYGHTHVQNMQKIYNRLILNVGSVGNALEVFKNDEIDGNDKNTTVANYLVLSGEYDSKDLNGDFSFELISVTYDIDKELSDNNSDTNIEFDSYEFELKNGNYRDTEKILGSFGIRGIDITKI